MSKRTSTLILCLFLSIGLFTELFSQVPGRVQYIPAISDQAVLDLVIDTFIANECFEVPLDRINFAGQTGNNASIGYFSDGNVALGLESGIVIANANITQFIGGNTATGIGDQLNLPGDPNLNVIEAFYGGTIGGIPGGPGGDVATFDAGFIEFDFIPTSESVSFNYVFASEEYCDFVGSIFNDKFGIFLSGPGITAADAPFVIGGQPAINLAEFVDANGNIENVSINNVNHGLNTNLYVDNNIANTSGAAVCATVNPANNPFTQLCQFDGWTVPLVASYDELEICETYRVRVSVADGSDRIFGSAVFLQTSSFNAAEGSSIAEIAFDGTGETFAYESCGDSVATVIFEREAVFGTNNFVDINMPIQFGGSAIFGVDYCTDLPFIGEIQVGPFGLVEEIVIKSDDQQEPVETIDISITNPCFCEPQIFQLEIIDVPPIEVQPLVGDTTCFGLSDRELEAFIIGGGFPSVDRADPPSEFMFVWSDENGVISTEQIAEVDVSAAGSYTYFLEVSDGCGQVHMDTVNFVTSGIPDAELEGETSICPESPTTVLGLTLSGAPPWTLQYNLDGIPQPPLLIEDPDFEFEVSESGMYEITRIDGPNCGQDVEGVALVADQSFDLALETTPTLCNDSEDGMLMALVANGSGTFEYLWSDEDAQTTEMAIGLAPGSYTVTVTDELGCTQELSAEVLPAPEVSVTPELISGTTCADLLSGELSAEGAGGNGEFEFEWFDNAGGSVGTGSTIDGLPAGDYRVVATDENGCQMESNINIPSDENTPDAFAMPTVIDCNNAEVTINTDGTSAGDDFTYEWTVNAGGGNIASGADTPNPVIDEPGSYTLTVTNTTNGCTAQTPVMVTDNRIDPVADAGTPFDCIDSEVMLGGVDLATGTNITYQWTASNGGSIAGASDIANPMVTEAGTYEVLVTNTENGCTSVSQVDVSVAPQIATEDPLPIDCRADGTVTLSGLGSETGTDISYEWIASNGGVIVSGNNSINPVVSESGTYSLVVTNSVTGCSSPPLEVVVEDIRTDLTADPGQSSQINCNNLSLELGGSNTSTGNTIIYDWQIVPDNGAPTTASTPNITATQGGTYTLLVTDTSNGCTAMNQVVILEDMTEPDVMINTPALLTCEADNQILDSNGSSTGDFTYTWTTMGGNILSSSNDQNVQIDDPGSYTLTITNNATGCTNSETVTVIEDAIFPEVIIADPLNIDCNNTEVLLDGSQSESGMGIEYTWRDENNTVIGNTASIQVDAGGQYTLEVNNTLTGCVETDPVMVMDIREDPTADVGDMQGLNCDITLLTLGGANLSTGPEFTYEWSLTGAGLISSEANPEIAQGGEYTLVVTNTINGCTAIELITIAEDMLDPDIDIEPSGVITCEDPIQSLLTDGSSSGGEFVYSWTGPNGFMSNLENPEITISGTYELTILNTTNMCSFSAVVDVDEDAEFPEIAIETPAVVNCENTIIELSGDGSEVGPDIVYVWVASNGGVIEDDEDTLNPEISAAGTYTLTVSNEATGCSRTLEVEVTDDFAEPTAMVNPNLTFGCQDDILNITGVGSSTGNNFEYLWTASPGNISGSTTDISTQIDQPGEYTLLVTNTDNGCTQTASFTVIPDEALPEITVAPAEMITCDRPMVTIDATGSASGAGLTFQWVMDGTPFTPDDNFVFTVDQPGMYTLIIEDTNNGCVSEQTIQVMEDTEDPIAEAGDGVILNCRDMMMNLDAGASSAGSEFEYSWTASNGGVIVSGADTDEPLVSEPGTYTLTVTNTLTGCQSVDEVPVLRNDFVPVIEFEEPAEINCQNETITIDAMGSDDGGIFELEWMEMGTANIVSGEETLTPSVDAPGTYVLIITNTDNFCVSMQEFIVTENIDEPDAEIQVPGMLNCATLEVELDGTLSSQGAGFTYEWSLVSGAGSFTGSTDEINTTVNGPGIYELLVTNSDNFCVNTTTIQVLQDIESPTAMTGPIQEVTCDQTLAQLSGAGSSTGPQFEYSWIPLSTGLIVDGANTLTPTVDSQGEYQLTVLNTENGCTSTSVQLVTSNEVFPQEAPPTPAVLNCEVLSQTLTSQDNPALSYLWTTEDGTELSTGSSVEVDEPGTYIMIITDNLTGCSTPNEFVVEQDITPPSVDAGPTSELTCTETIAVLAGSGSEGSNFTYEWTTIDGLLSGPVDELEAFANARGTYTLTIFNEENRCSASSDVVITLAEDVPSGVDVEPISPACFGDLGSIVFNDVIGGVGPFMYSIDGGQTFSDETIFSNLTPGETFDLLIEDANGCEVFQQLTIPTVDSLSVNVAEPMVELELGESFNINAFTTFPDNEIVSITWTPEDGLSCTDCLNPTVTPGFSISYEVMVVSENGCVDNAVVQFRVDRNIDIYIPNAFSPHNDDGVNDLFMPFGKPSVVATVQSFQIYDRWGEQVFFDEDFQLNDPARGWNGVFRDEDAPTGVYVYYIVLELVDGSTELFEGDVTLMN